MGFLLEKETPTKKTSLKNESEVNSDSFFDYDCRRSFALGFIDYVYCKKYVII